MIVVDSCGWISFFANDSKAKHYLPAFRRQDQLAIVAVSLYEVYRWLLREVGPHEALALSGNMLSIKLIETDREIALSAAELSLGHRIPMADSIILASAKHIGADLWTHDSHFKDIEQVKYFGD